MGAQGEEESSRARAIQRLVAADCFLQAAQQERERLIREARRQGYSWACIGDALGVSKQAAWERYHHLEMEP